MLQLHLEDIRHAEIALLAGRFRKRPVSVTFVIGGKLRALYDEHAQPSPDRFTELLTALDGSLVVH
jgi:anti-sigma factor NepR-like protein